MGQFFLWTTYLLLCFCGSWMDSCGVVSGPSQVLQHVILLVVLPIIPLVKSQGKFKTTTPVPTTPTETYTTMRKHYFEDVDWALHPVAYRERNDCYGHYIKCIRRTTPIIAVCGYNIWTEYFEDYYSKCEIEYENCEYRVRYRAGIYGGNWWSNKIYHNGEAYNCKALYRRANSPEDLDRIYFGGDKNMILNEWQKANLNYYRSSPFGPDAELEEFPRQMD